MINNENCISEILSDCVMAFICPRGEFYPNKDYGSQIKKNITGIDAQRLLAFARQAVSNMDGVFVKNALIRGSNADFTVMINDEERQVSIAL